MRKKSKIILIILFTLLVIFSKSKIVKADGISVDVKVILPSNQTEGINGWFDVHVKPGDKQIFQLKVNNHSKKQVYVEVKPTDATTSQNGEMDYEPYKGPFDPTLKYRFPKLTQKAQRIHIPANSSKMATFTVKVPKKAKNQMIMGGFYVSQLDDKPKKQVVKKGEKQKVQIRNYYSYTIAALMSIGKLPDPNVRLVSVAPGLQSGYAAFGANLQNDKANYVSQMKVKAKIIRKSSGKVVTERSQSAMTMAPNSNFIYYMQVGRSAIKPGTYHLDLVASGSGKKWHISRDFEVTASQANEVNANNVLLPKSNLWIYILIAVIILILFIAVVVFVYFKGQNKAQRRLETNLQIMRKSADNSNGQSNKKIESRNSVPRRKRK
ncbi:DUF916 and DUF3324 domain-containing protein [Xylocopilactobacillus apis]|uniref:Cell surface protein n=1 Tax=Xylocopilactobacillus apis TaxID=2932183 RepID=A0AAU9D796_9LACO|nr:DUF916 and DUF3324 domain-containing protein [Xylocopilactobacillus apis]BDR57295.1 cell surface protein [Xylocopilactobacillus apis]